MLAPYMPSVIADYACRLPLPATAITPLAAAAAAVLHVADIFLFMLPLLSRHDDAASR